jgi:GDPmannose 4,6-dehydratase
VSKIHAHHTAKYYRDYYKLFVSCGILFNHESPRRGEEFVTQKIIKAVKEIKNGDRERLELGDLSPKRDWGYAPEYVQAMYDMLHDDHADDYVIATGESHSVRDFTRAAFSIAGLGDYRKYVSENIHPRPAEVYELCGDSSKALKMLGWRAETKMRDLIKIMLEQDENHYIW